MLLGDGSYFGKCIRILSFANPKTKYFCVHTSSISRNGFYESMEKKMLKKQNALPQELQIPQGFSSFVTCANIKNNSEDLTVVCSERPCNAVAMFTKNKVKGNPVLVGKKHIKDGSIQAIVVNSKNANVATGKQGYQDALNICKKVAEELDISCKNVFPSSTGIIGRRLPVEKITSALNSLKSNLKTPADFSHVAKAIMTTDTFAKTVSVTFDGITICGIAKGSGMIEPNMATMLAYFFTDAKISSKQLSIILKKIVKKTFNSLSVDTDTSTSDTVLLMANGMVENAKKKNSNKKKFIRKFSEELEKLATELTRMLARDGEGATKLFTVDVIHAKSKHDAKKIGKSIINSPLVKTAIYKGDPNWGRIFMAVGKTPNVKINPNTIKLFWGKDIRYYDQQSEEALQQLHSYLSGSEEIFLTVDLQQGKKNWRVYGCDLTEEYVHINAYYST